MNGKTNFVLYVSIESCSHNIVKAYFSESITNTNGFVSTKCESFEEFELGSCMNNKKITLGGTLSPEDEGVYYLHTNKWKPFSKQRPYTKLSSLSLI